ncbi:MAG: hypothetical protein R3C68_18690 [Myxococcota bacterium]
MFARQLSTLTVALCLGISGSALATQSRSESLLFNMAIEDQTDVFMFPHQLNRYQGAYFHAPENAANIFGGIMEQRLNLPVSLPIVPSPQHLINCA